MCLATYSQSGSYWLFSLTDVKFHKLLKTSAKKKFSLSRPSKWQIFSMHLQIPQKNYIFSLLGPWKWQIIFHEPSKTSAELYFQSFKALKMADYFSWTFKDLSAEVYFQSFKALKMADYFPQTFKDLSKIIFSVFQGPENDQIIFHKHSKTLKDSRDHVYTEWATLFTMNKCIKYHLLKSA